MADIVTVFWSDFSELTTFTISSAIFYVKANILHLHGKYSDLVLLLSQLICGYVMDSANK